MRNQLLPVFLNLHNQNCLVIGGGNIAYQKINQLLESNAKITVVSKKCNTKIINLFNNNQLLWISDIYKVNYIKNMKLIIGATSSQKVNQQIFNDSNQLNIPVNIVDQPELCSFYFGAVHSNGNLKFSVSTNGKSPIIAKRIRDLFVKSIPLNTDEIIEKFGEIRKNIQTKLSTYYERKQFFERLANIHFHSNKAKVTILGAGPGDPELISIKGFNALMNADIILYDALVSKDLVENINLNAEKINVGKRAGKHNFPQESINKLIVSQFHKNKNVVRLKGGDPFIFGRGGEECEYLSKNNIKFEIIPGISSGIGIPSQLGIPLTHRNYTKGVIFLTGHEIDNSINWDAISKSNMTLVIYMGYNNINSIIDCLIKNGKSSNTSIGLIQKGTTKDQKIIIGEIGTINKKLKEEKLRTPVLIIIGEVVNIYSQIKNSLNYYSMIQNYDYENSYY